jgi:hypothetical protein
MVSGSEFVEALLRKIVQNGPGIKRAAQRADEFLSCLAARIRALCASEEDCRRHTGGANF